jgi:hypothetical protein
MQNGQLKAVKSAARAALLARQAAERQALRAPILAIDFRSSGARETFTSWESLSARTGLAASTLRARLAGGRTIHRELDDDIVTIHRLA